MSSDNEESVPIPDDGNVDGNNVEGEAQPAVGDLERYCEDDSLVPPSDRMRFHMTLCFEYVENFQQEAKANAIVANSNVANVKKQQPFVAGKFVHGGGISGTGGTGKAAGLLDMNQKQQQQQQRRRQQQQQRHQQHQQLATIH